VALPAHSAGAIPKIKGTSGIESTIRAQLKRRVSTRFETLLNRWKRDYGTKAVSPLSKIAQDRKVSDASRYIAMMGATRLGGQGSTSLLYRLLKDKSWMIRSGSLKALRTVNPKTGSEKLLPLLKDKALVVRREAVIAVAHLNPKGSINAVMETLFHSANYHGGRAQWVPLQALDALVKLGATKEMAKNLVKLFSYKKDRKLARKTVHTLKKITGHRRPASVRTLNEQIAYWKKRAATL